VQLDSAVVRVRDRHQRVMGGGFLAHERYVLTCAHVVARALGLPDDVPLPPDAEVRLDFPLIARDQTVMARVVVWHPPAADGEGDIAGLELTGDPPRGAQAARLLMADELWRHEFRTFGFPAGYDDGVWVSGRLLARQAMQWVQMEDVKQTGYRVEPGFSGAPVWDDELDGVVGITVAAERRADVRAAYLIPAGVLVDAWPALATHAIPPCPYRGLSAFREQDAPVFFGRGKLTNQLVDTVLRNLFVAVIGASGGGKSSLVFAGLMPRLRQRSGWVVASLRPAAGGSPLAALAAALMPLLEPEMGEATRLLELPALARVLGNRQLAEVVDRVLARANARRLLLVVDQFEELFALEAAEWRQFVGVILEGIAVQQRRAESALAVALTLRTDFLSHALTHAGLAEALQSAGIMLGPMTREQLRQAIEGPAAHQVSCEPGLVGRVLDDVGENPGNLPLLEFALTLLWERQTRGKLTHAAYDELGGVDGALAWHAEEVYLRLPEAEREAARRLFVQLFRPGEGTEHTRRVARRTEIGDGLWSLAQRLATTRLVVTDRDAAGVETVEVVHEALLSSWSRLRQWIEIDSEFRAWQERLRTSVTQWEASNRDKGALLRGAPLAEADRWLQQRPTDISPTEQMFVRASHARESRALRQLRGLATGLAALLVAATTFGVLAVQQGRHAATERLSAVSRQLAAEADARLTSAPQLSMLLSLQAYATTPTHEARKSLLDQVEQRRGVEGFLTGHTDSVEDVAFSPDGSILASGSNDKTVILWDTFRRSRLAILSGHQNWVTSVAFSPDGHILASGSADRQVILWNVDRRTRVATLTGHSKPVTSVAFSPDRHTLASGSSDKTVRLWDVPTRTQLATLTGHSKPVTGVAFSPDGHTLASASNDKSIVLWNVARRDRQTTFTGHTDVVTSVAFSPDGHTLASGSNDNTVRLWDAVRRTHDVSPPVNHANWVTSVAFSPDGHTLATGSVDRAIVLWRVADLAMTGHNKAVTSLAYSPDGRTLASGSSDDTIILWRATWHTRLATLTGHTGEVTSVAFSPDGRTLVSGSSDKTVRLWDVASRTQLATLTGHTKRVNSVAYSPDGRTLASGSSDKTVRLWDVPTRTQLATLTGHTDEVTSVAYSPDGRTLASGSLDNTISLWDVSKRARLSVLPGHSNWVVSVAFSPDGHTLASGSVDNTVILWDVPRRSRIGTLSGHSNWVVGVAFSPDGRFLASASNDRTIIMWDVASRTRLGTLTGHTDQVAAVRFSPDGRTLASASWDTTVILWNLDPFITPKFICDVVGRGLTRTEWAEFLSQSPYRDICAITPTKAKVRK
jgi:WD40 repeat protein